MAENESVVEFILERTDLALAEATCEYGSHGVILKRDASNDDPNSAILANKVRRFWPAGPEDSIGFFYQNLSNLYA